MMSQKALQSHRFDARNASEAMEFYYAKGWTDGLPVIPPTENKIRAMLEAAALEPDTEITFIEDRQVPIIAEKAAINAVMAGCKPEYMPVIVAALQAIGDPLYGYHGPATSTGGAAVFMLVNGPIAQTLEINCGDNLFGPGWRANATIGRAVRLVMRNVIGTLPGLLDRSTLGHGGKYTFCIAENEEKSPWRPVHVERGFRPGQNVVTVLAALAPHQCFNQLSNTAEGILTTFCALMRFSPGVRGQPEHILVIAGEHMEVFVKDGWSKDDIKQFCFEHTRTSFADLKRANIMPGTVIPEDEHTFNSVVQAPEDFIVVAAGGRAGAFSAFIPGWSGKRGSESVSREICMP